MTRSTRSFFLLRRWFPVVLLASLVLAACAGAGADAGAPPGDESLPSIAGAPVVTTVESVSGANPHVVYRERREGDLRSVEQTVAGIVIVRHVIGPRDHWWWLSPEVAATLGVEAFWVHVDLQTAPPELADIPTLAEVRTPLPDPAKVSPGDLVLGTLRVAEVVDIGDAAVRLVIEGAPDLELRRRQVDGPAEVSPPLDAVAVEDLTRHIGR